MASPTQWTWVWINSGRWQWTGRPGVLQSMGLQRVRHDWATELNWKKINTETLKLWNYHSRRYNKKSIFCLTLQIFFYKSHSCRICCLMSHTTELILGIIVLKYVFNISQRIITIITAWPSLWIYIEFIF